MARNFMAFSHIVSAIIGFSASFFLCLPNLKNWQRRKNTKEKLRIIWEALENAEDRVIRFEERHDLILSQICSFYLLNQDLEETLEDARKAMNETLKSAVDLRRYQLEIIKSYPCEVQYFLTDGSPNNLRAQHEWTYC